MRSHGAVQALAHCAVAIDDVPDGATYFVSHSTTQAAAFVQMFGVAHPVNNSLSSC